MLFSQGAKSRAPLFSDSCNYRNLKAGSSSIGYNPLYVANGIVVSSAELDSTLITDITVIQCPESSRKFSYIAAGGAIVINTRQTFITTTPKFISDSNMINGKILYAVNGCLLVDSTLKISKEAIIEIEIYTATENKFNNVECINIWTIPKPFRKS